MISPTPLSPVEESKEACRMLTVTLPRDVWHVLLSPLKDLRLSCRRDGFHTLSVCYDEAITGIARAMGTQDSALSSPRDSMRPFSESEWLRVRVRDLAAFPELDLRDAYQYYCATTRRYASPDISEAEMLRELMRWYVDTSHTSPSENPA